MTDEGSPRVIWATVAKKRRVSHEPIITENRFSPLSSDRMVVDEVSADASGSSSANISRNGNADNDQLAEIKPPPIVVSGVTNYEQMIRSLNSIIGENLYSCKTQADGDVRILTNTIAHYRSLEEFLNKMKLEYHTYQVKSERTFDVVLHNLHRSYDQGDLKEILNAKGHKVKSMSLMQRSVFDRHLQTRVFVDMDKFLIHLEPAPNNKEIYTITKIDHSCVVFEPRNQKKDPVGPQCRRCWKRGHTKNFCRKEIVCGICTGDHWTDQCQQPKTVLPVCINCNQNHTANYKGCIDYQAKLRRRERMNEHRVQQQRQREPFNIQDHNFQPLHNEEVRRGAPSGQLYSEITKGDSFLSKIESMMEKQIDMMNKLMTMMVQMMSFMQSK